MSSLPVTLVNVFFAIVPFVSFDAVTRVLGHQVIASGPVLTRVTRTLVDVNLTIVSFVPVGTTANVAGQVTKLAFSIMDHCKKYQFSQTH